MRQKSSLKIIIGSIGICLLSGLCGCAGENVFTEYAMSIFGSEYDTREQQTQAEMEEVRQSSETETELQEAKEQADGEALEEAYRLILEEASEEFFWNGFPQNLAGNVFWKQQNSHRLFHRIPGSGTE